MTSSLTHVILLVTCLFAHHIHARHGTTSVREDETQLIRLLRELSKQENLISLRDLVTEAEAEVWLDTNDVILASKRHEVALASWAYSTNITEENSETLSDVSVAETLWRQDRDTEAKHFLDSIQHFQNKTALRMLEKWVESTCIAKDPEVERQISKIGNELETIYGSAQVEKDGKIYRIEPEFIQLMEESRDYDELLWAWKSWRDVTGPEMRSKFTELVAFMNTAAIDNGLSDMGESWRISNYEDDNMEDMVDALYAEILPLYKELHAYVRMRLSETYAEVSDTGPLPAHVLGNMWAQEWTDIYDLVAPYPEVPADDVTQAMLDQGYTVDRMFRTAEDFFTSLGMEPMTDKFWARSMLVRPSDNRAVQCHGSAEDFSVEDDFRIKMCTEVDANYLQTIHHEMGHIEYFMQYRHQPTVFRGGANAAFHEAVGDTIALSVTTPRHLRTIGLLLDTSHKDSRDTDLNMDQKSEINYLMKVALQKVAFLPFGYLIDKWRWEVFRGNINANNYNSKWWEYREQYQGVKAPIERSESDFDPGAKFHVPASVPYIRYFLSFIGQFQFQEALCNAAGHEGKLHDCDIYQSLEAGELFMSVLELGCSRPWPEVMEKLTGKRVFDSRAIRRYFSPLKTWLRAQNNGYNVGW